MKNYIIDNTKPCYKEQNNISVREQLCFDNLLCNYLIDQAKEIVNGDRPHEVIGFLSMQILHVARYGDAEAKRIFAGFEDYYKLKKQEELKKS